MINVETGGKRKEGQCCMHTCINVSCNALRMDRLNNCHLVLSFSCTFCLFQQWNCLLQQTGSLWYEVICRAIIHGD